MDVEFSVTALDARVECGPNKNGLCDVVKEVFLIVTARHIETGREEHEAISVMLKSARPSTFQPLQQVTPEMLTSWALSTIKNDMAMSDYLARTKDELADRVRKPAPTHRAMFGFIDQHGMEKA